MKLYEHVFVSLIIGPSQTELAHVHSGNEIFTVFILQQTNPLASSSSPYTGDIIIMLKTTRRQIALEIKFSP